MKSELMEGDPIQDTYTEEELIHSASRRGNVARLGRTY